MRIRHHHTDKRPGDMTRKQQPTQQQQDKKWNLSKCLFFTKLVLYLIPHRPFSSHPLSCYFVAEVDAVYRRKKIETVVGTKPVTTAILHRRQRPFFPVMKRQQKSEQSTISFSTTVDTTDDPVRVWRKGGSRRWKNEREWKFCSYFLLKRIKPVYYFNITFWNYFTSPRPSSCGLSPDVVSCQRSSPSDELKAFNAPWKKGLTTVLFLQCKLNGKLFSEIWRSRNENWIDCKRFKR